MADDQTTTQDPTTQHPQPEQPELQLDHPGHETEMRPRADHGEESYWGSGRLQGRRARPDARPPRTDEPCPHREGSVSRPTRRASRLIVGSDKVKSG